MALTQEELQNLEAANFTSLYKKDKQYWDAKTKEAYKYTRTVLPEDAEIRPDDVATYLVPTINQNLKFKTYLQRKKTMQKYWCKCFADFIIDRYFKEDVAK